MNALFDCLGFKQPEKHHHHKKKFHVDHQDASQQVDSPNCLEAALKNYSNLAISILLVLICFISAAVRVRSVLIFESIIHEADPWFNYRVSKYISENGYIAFKNWFDDKAWYPYGRLVYRSCFAGMMYTSNIIHKVVTYFVPDVDIREVCVFNGVIFAVPTVLVTYLINFELFNKSSGLLGALLIGLIPGLVARTHAGSYDYESMAIFQIQLIIYFWIKAYKNGSMVYGGFAGLAYFYLNSTWGGIIYVTNMISGHAFLIALSEGPNLKLIRAFSSLVAVQTLLSVHVPFGQYLHFNSMETIMPYFTLLFMICCSLVKSLAETLNSSKKSFSLLAHKSLIMNTSIAFFVAFCMLVYSGKLRGFSGRIMLLFTPGAMRDLSPLASSVAEHSGTKWSHLFLIIGASLLVCPLGVFLLFIREDPTNWILILQYIALSFFSSRMNRLKLLLAPSISLLAGYTIAEIAQLSQNKLKNTLKGFQLITTMLPVSHHSHFKAKLSSNFKSKSALVSSSNILDMVVLFIVGHSVAHYISVDVSHFVYNGVTQYMHLADRPTTINDDVKNSYDWIASNSPADSKIASWWDYGYQIAGFTDRTVVVDNFTSIALSIAIMGMIMAGKEDLAIKFLRHLKINYILVFAPGVADHMMGHDISKMYWMIRISQGVFPQLVDESLYIGRSHLDVGEKATEAMIDSVMYKTCFYDFDKIKNGPNGETGVNPSTGTQVHTAATNQPIKFKYLEEAFSSQYRTIRIFKVKQPSRYWVEKEDVPF